MRWRFLILTLGLHVLLSRSWGAEPPSFEQLASYKGLGGVESEIVGPGPREGVQRYYAIFSYAGDTFDLVSVSPDGGTTSVFPNPVAGEFGARAMVAGPDGKVYIGTLPHAHLLQFDPKTGEIVDLGRPVASETYIWDLCLGSDGRIYGGTFPSAKLIRYDPKRKEMTDLGRMDPTEQYAHTVAASRDGFVYAGIGASKANIAAYEIATGKMLEIGPPEYRTAGIASVFRGDDGKVYVAINGHYFRLNQWELIPINSMDVPSAHDKVTFSSGQSAEFQESSIVIKNSQAAVVSRTSTSYEGRALSLFRLGAGLPGTIYGSTAIPIHIIRYDAGSRRLSEIGSAGAGETYSFLYAQARLLMAAYAGIAPLLEFDPSKPFSRDPKNQNPVLVYFTGQDLAWRPQAMIVGPDSQVYIGSVAGYGKLSGAISAWDVGKDVVVSYPDVVHNQGITSFAVYKDLLVGGSTILGGGGSTPSEAEAVLFLWDTREKKKVFQLVPVPGAKGISDLIVARNGLIFGIAGEQMFVFDPAQRKVIRTQPLPFVMGAAIQTLYNSVGMGPDGRIWGLAPGGVFEIVPEEQSIRLERSAPCKISAGFVLSENSIYFGCDSELWRFHLPRATDLK
jgi:hypothetical protein